MTHEDRPYELHDESLATLTRDKYLKFRHMHSQSFSASSPSHHEPYKLKTSFSGESKHQTPSESQTALSNYKKGPQRKAFFSQQEEISEDDEYASAEEQFSTDPEPEEHSPYSVYQSSFHPKMPQKSFISPNTWETLSESTKQMNIEHNKKVKLNNPTPYPSGSKTKPNPTLGKPTPAPQVLKNLNFQLCSTSLVLSSSLKQLVYMYLSQLMSTFTNYLKVHCSLDGYFIL